MSLTEIGGRSINAGDARRRWSVRRGWRIELDGGVGEASPLPGLSLETHEEVGEALSRYLAGDEVELPPSARFAVETARADAAARRRGVSVAEILGGPSGAVARGSELGFDPSASCRCAKLKAGPAAAWPGQRAAIDALLARRPDLRIRIDFSGSLSITEAGSILDEIAAARWPIDFVEDPTPAAQLEPLPVPVAIDAAISEPGGLDRARELAAGGAAAVAVIKPALVGGLLAAREIAGELAAAGLAPVISHLLDGPIALAACAELACVVGGVLAHGVGVHPGLASYGAGALSQLDGALLRPRRGGLC